MNFLRVREGMLVINVDAIASMERSPTGDDVLVLMQGCNTYRLFGSDAQRMMEAVLPAPAFTVQQASGKPKHRG